MVPVTYPAIFIINYVTVAEIHVIVSTGFRMRAPAQGRIQGGAAVF